MDETKVRDLHPKSENFSLDIEYAIDCDYLFILEDGSNRRVRANTMSSFKTITEKAIVIEFW